MKKREFVPMPHSDACERNKGPILEVLRVEFSGVTHVLEIGSGTGQHAVHFALALPGIVWQPSERAEFMPGLRKRVFNEGPKNLRAPVEIDVTVTPWDVRRVDGVYTANTLHIMHWPQVQAFFANLPAVCSRSTGRSVTAGSTRPPAMLRSTKCCARAIQKAASASSRQWTSSRGRRDSSSWPITRCRPITRP